VDEKDKIAHGVSLFNGTSFHGRISCI